MAFILIGWLNTGAQTEVVAIVNGTAVTQKDIDTSIIAKILPLQEQINALRKSALDNIILKIILVEEAKKKGITLEAYRKTLTSGDVQISEDNIEKIYLENFSAFALMSSEEAKERVRLDLESQEKMRNYRGAVQTLKQKAKIELNLDKFSLPKLDLDDSGPAKGRSDASIKIIEFSDFRCSHCRSSYTVLNKLIDKYGKNIRFIYKHSLLDSNSFPAAQASFCADSQGKFWKYHDELFVTNDFSNENLIRIAEKNNLNIGVFRKCLSSSESRNAILRDIQEAKRIGVEGTPSFVINGKIIRGAISLEKFEGFINDELIDK